MRVRLKSRCVTNDHGQRVSINTPDCMSFNKKSCVFYVYSNYDYWNHTLRYCGGSDYMLVPEPHLDYDALKRCGFWDDSPSCLTMVSS